MLIKIIAIASFIGVLVLAVAVIKLSQGLDSSKQQQSNDSENIINATFNCDGGKTIMANFFSEKIELSLSDKRNFLLMQGISGSGARYTNNDESVTFWNKGNTAFIEEGEKTTFNNCVQQNS